MFKTKDGFSVNLRDSIYVIFNRYKINKLGRHYQSRDNTDIAIYRMEVFGIHAISWYDRENNPVDVYYAEGAAYDVNDILSNGKPEENAPFYSNVYALQFNTFVTRNAAEAALPEFRRRGLVSMNHALYFADELVCNAAAF
ncbi:MAG: hypothetical protein LBS19_09745 [Clostridiales bacterium]|jgi:hypothetical protein|nr:hypothetical protein [Clostridiales bacterium]